MKLNTEEIKMIMDALQITIEMCRYSRDDCWDEETLFTHYERNHGNWERNQLSTRLKKD